MGASSDFGFLAAISHPSRFVRGVRNAARARVYPPLQTIALKGCLREWPWNDFAAKGRLLEKRGKALGFDVFLECGHPVVARAPAIGATPSGNSI
jgi:hypothetical protein